MENFHNHLSNIPFAEDYEKTSHAAERRQSTNSTRSSNIHVSEADVLVSDKSPTFSTLPLNQYGGFPYSSAYSAVFPQDSSARYDEKSLGQCSNNSYRLVGVDMTNRNVPVNVSNPNFGLESSYLSGTKFINDGPGVHISEPITSSKQTVNTVGKSAESTPSGNIKIQNHGNIIINMSVAEKTEGERSNSLSADLHSVNMSRSCGSCEEKSSINCVFSCGGCRQSFYTICKLHSHIKTHNHDGSYYYSESTKTAYPKFGTCCIGTQTEDGKKGRKHSKHKVESVEILNSSKDGEDNVFSKEVEANVPSGRIDLVNETLINEDEAEIKVEKDDSDYIPDLSNVNRSGSDTDEYKPEESILHSQKKRQKRSSKKRNGRNRVKMKGSKKLKKLKMTIKLKQEERKDKRVSFLKKDRKPKLNSKMKVQIKKVDEKITCKLCDVDFSKRLYLRHHIKAKHSDVEHLCQLCSDHFSTDDELIEHRKTVHNRGYHRCELCDKVLSTKGMLEGHYLVHKGIKPFACDICVPKKEFTRKCQLKAHMDTHSTEKTLQCEFCGKPFNARYLMLSHVKHCGGIKPHKCDYCEMSFVSNHCLQRHRRTHTGEKPFVCEVCAFASSNASCLARHLRTHTGEKPFTCQYCQQTFAARGALKKHVRIHTQEKPYKCRFCTKAFTQNWNLKTHERQHTGETPYKCHVCGIGYKQNVLLKTHLRTHYGQNTESSESQNLTLNQSVSHCQTENQTSVHNQSLVSLQSGSKPDNLKLEFSQSQSINSQPQLIELHTQPLVPNILLSSFLHSGYNMN